MDGLYGIKSLIVQLVIQANEYFKDPIRVVLLIDILILKSFISRLIFYKALK